MIVIRLGFARACLAALTLPLLACAPREHVNASAALVRGRLEVASSELAKAPNAQALLAETAADCERAPPYGDGLHHCEVDDALVIAGLKDHAARDVPCDVRSVHVVRFEPGMGGVIEGCGQRVAYLFVTASAMTSEAPGLDGRRAYLDVTAFFRTTGSAEGAAAEALRRMPPSEGEAYAEERRTLTQRLRLLASGAKALDCPLGEVLPVQRGRAVEGCRKRWTLDDEPSSEREPTGHVERILYCRPCGDPEPAISP